MVKKKSMRRPPRGGGSRSRSNASGGNKNSGRQRGSSAARYKSTGSNRSRESTSPYKSHSRRTFCRIGTLLTTGGRLPVRYCGGQWTKWAEWKQAHRLGCGTEVLTCHTNPVPWDFLLRVVNPLAIRRLLDQYPGSRMPLGLHCSFIKTPKKQDRRGRRRPHGGGGRLAQGLGVTLFCLWRRLLASRHCSF